MLFRFAVESDAPRLAEIALRCADELPRDFTLKLGKRFLTAYYRQILSDPQNVTLCAVDESGTVAGFHLGTLDSAATLRHLRKGKIKLGIAAGTALLMQPRLAAGIWQRFRASGDTSQAEEYIVSEGARATFLGIDPALRRGPLAFLLLRKWLKIMKLLDQNRIQLDVNRDNERALEMYHRLGAVDVREFRTPDGIERLVMEYHL